MVGCEEDDTAEDGFKYKHEGIGGYYCYKVVNEVYFEGNLKAYVVTEVVSDDVGFSEEGPDWPAVSDILAINPTFHLVIASLSLELEVIGESQDIEAHICEDVEFEFRFEGEEGQFYFFHLEEEIKFAIWGYFLRFVQEDGFESLEVSCSSIFLAGNQKLLKHFRGLYSTKTIIMG